MKKITSLKSGQNNHLTTWYKDYIKFPSTLGRKGYTNGSSKQETKGIRSYRYFRSNSHVHNLSSELALDADVLLLLGLLRRPVVARLGEGELVKTRLCLLLRNVELVKTSLFVCLVM